MTRESSRATFRLRLVAGCALLVGLAFIQSPGYLIADTKFDLAVDPLGFLSRALHLWDGTAAFGQLQNQAYGYLWPMGPFFVLGDLLGLPGWVTQRLWLALVLCVAFAGVALLARALGVRSQAACLIAGFAYATSPRLLSTLGPISIEAWPSAVAPWVLLPLVVGAASGSPRRMAMWAGLAVAMVGGVNAAATFAVLPLGVVWLLTRRPGPRQRSLLLWWPVFTALGTMWWLVPLFVMGAYSPPFLDFIETASVTTFPTTTFDALRGTSAWVPYIDPSWQGGRITVTEGYLALNSGLLLLLGMAGLLHPGNPHRRFLAIGAVVGLLLVGTGHLGAVQGWFAQPLNELLDGALAPLRNVHKFDPVVRLPLVLGLAWLLEMAARGRRPEPIDVAGRSVSLSPRVIATGLALVGVVGAALPAVTGRLAPTDPVLTVPDYWHEAIDWLDDADAEGVTLLAPGSSFAEYLWGAPRDEPAQFLSEAPWAVRNAVPLTPPGTIRMLDAFEQRMAEGRPSRGLATYLTRAGVRYLLVRNDLTPSTDVPDPVLVHQALDASPGLSLVKRFGPEVGGEASLETEEGRLLVNGGWQERRRVLELYAVAGQDRQAVSTSSPPVVVGGPEDLLDLGATGAVGEQPAVLAADTPPDQRLAGRLLLTDGMLDRERFFGRVHDGYSAVLTDGDVPRSGNPMSDYLLSDERRWLTTSRLVGARSLSASSSMSDATAPGGARRGELPLAAVDGLGESEWVSGALADEPAWWQMDLPDSRAVSEVTVSLGERGEERSRFRVVTEEGPSDEVVLDRGETRTVEVPGGSTRWVRVESRAGARAQLALAEVTLPGVAVRRELVLPEVPAVWGAPEQILLRALRDSRTGCAAVAGRTPCLEERAVASEEPGAAHRVVTLPRAEAYDASLTAVPRAGADLVALLQQDQPRNATGSSVGVPDPRASGLATIDGDLGTSWTPSLDDGAPRLALNWIGERTVRGLRVHVSQSAPVRRPRTVRLTWPGGERLVELSRKGRGRVRPFRADRLTLTIVEAGNAASVDAAGIGSGLPTGISEVRLWDRSRDRIFLSTDERRWACGTGPDLVVNGEATRTRLVASPVDLYGMQPVPAVPCGSAEVELRAGRNRVSMLASAHAAPDQLLLGEGGPTAPPPTASLASPSPVERDVDPGDGDLVVLRQNANEGWTATQEGTRLDPVVVDGWQQGWRTEDSSASVRAEFGPDRAYRAGLLVGAGLLALLVAAAAVPGRRWPGRRLAPSGPAGWSWPVAGAAALLSGGLLAGWPGVAAAAVGAALGSAVLRLRSEVAAWLVAVLPFAASLGYFARPWGDAGGWAGTWAWPHYLVVVAVGAVLAASARRPTSLKRMAGSSTRR